MKNLITLAFIILMVIGCKNKPEKLDENASSGPIKETNSDDPSTAEWIVLFDGTSLDAWQYYQGGKPTQWKIENEAMVFNPPTPEERKEANEKGGSNFNIVTKKEFTSFVLSLEWKISEGGNSGIMWGVNDDEKFKEPYRTGMEVQVLDNQNHPDAKNGTTHQAGALYDLVEPAKDVTKAVGEWNTCVITIDYKVNKGSSVLNGVEVATFPVGGNELDALLKGSKFDGWEGFAKYKTGKITLQDHGDVVAYRNIRIKEL